MEEKPKYFEGMHGGEDRLPGKIRVAVIVGYNGTDFCGS